MNTKFLDAACQALRFDPLERGLQIVVATNLARQHFPRLDPDQPVLIAQLNSRALARDCARALLVLYPRDHIVTLIDSRGSAEQRIETLPLASLDRWPSHTLAFDNAKSNVIDQNRREHATMQDRLYTSQTMLFIPPLPRAGSLNALAEIVAHLRAPKGCPWDREQTHKSLRKYLLEEAYEALEAIDEGDIPHLREELGDLLAHLLLQIQIAYEAHEFSLSDVVAEISEKLVRRHPHVFGDVKISGMPELLENWERIKQEESSGERRPADDLRTLPALMRAQKVASKRKTRVSAKAIAGEIERLPRAKEQEKRLGEILFALAAYASAKHIDAESALRAVSNQIGAALDAIH